MDKQSIHELQKIDCNCSDCKFMIRDLDLFKKAIANHHRWALNYFNTIQGSLYEKASNWKRRGFPEKGELVKKEADKMKFQFNKKEVTINYGDCEKYNKPVTFIPNICQLETQECFKHRRDKL